MANHALPTTTDLYANVLTYLHARIDDSSKWYDSALSYTNPPTGVVRWNSTSLTWQKNTGTPAAPVWSALSTSYAININGTVGATTAATGAFTTLSTSGVASLAASSTVGGSAIVTVGGTQTFTGVNTFTNANPIVSAKIGPVSGTQMHTLPAVTSDTIALLAATQTLTNKTYSAGALSGTFTGSHTLSGQVTFNEATAPIIAAKIGPSNTQQHTLPVIASDTIALLAAAQTLTNKTLTGATLTGSAFNGTVGATTPSTGAFTTLSASGDITRSGNGGNGVVSISAINTGTAINDAVRVFVDNGNATNTNQDAYFLARTNGVLWSAGIDHSDSDAWKLDRGASPGSSTVLRADASGLAVTGALSASGAVITSTSSGQAFGATNATTGAIYSLHGNTAGQLVTGLEGSVASLITGATGYDGLIRSVNPISFSANGGANLHMRLSSTGLAVTGTLSSTGSLSSTTGGALVNWGIAGSTDGVNGWQIRSATAANGLTIANYANNITYATLDTAGNLGLGVTPSVWGANWKAIQTGAYGAIAASSANTSTYLFSNAYINSGGVFTYIASTVPTAAYGQVDGAHRFYTAPSGTAGNPITFTERMNLSSVGLAVTGALSATSDLTLSGADGKILGGTAAGRAIWGNSGTSAYAVAYGASHATLPNQYWMVAGSAIAALSSTGLAVTGTVSSTGVVSIDTTTNASRRIELKNAGVSQTYFGSSLGILGSDGANDTALIAWTGNNLHLGANGAKQATLDAAGNLGLGVTPSAWTTGWKALQIASTSAITDFSSQSTYWNNTYVTAATTPTYQTTAAASFYRQTVGAHIWFTAPSGTAGNPITFTQAMTLDASGNLLVGTATANPYPTQGLSIYGNNGGSALIGMGHASGTASGNAYLTFAYNGAAIGSITQNGTTGITLNGGANLNLTGTTVTAPTVTASDNSTSVATTAFVNLVVRPGIVTISGSVATNALTITASNLVLDFRSATLGSGSITTVRGTPSSLVVPSTATLGTVSAQQSRLVVIAINNAGALELAVVNISGGNDLTETGLITTTAITTAADAANVIYSTTARTSVAYRVIGYIESTQATAGTWVTAPSTIQGSGGQALSTMSSLGYSQTWTNVISSPGRALSTTYYNTTGRPIQLSITLLGNPGGGAASIAINGVTVGTSGTASLASGAAYPYFTNIVPPGASYSVTAGTGAPTLQSWYELR